MFLGKNYIACLSPHPDDCEYAIAGTIRKFLDTEFHIYNISDGGRFDHLGGDIRKLEVESFWSSYENVKLFFVGEQYIRDIQNDLFIMNSFTQSPEIIMVGLSAFTFSIDHHSLA